MRRNCLFFFLGMMMSFVVSCSKQLNYEDIGVDMDQLQGEWYSPVAKNAYNKVIFDGKTCTRQMFIDEEGMGASRYPYSVRNRGLKIHSHYYLAEVPIVGEDSWQTILALDNKILVVCDVDVVPGGDRSVQIYHRNRDDIEEQGDNDYDISYKMNPRSGLGFSLQPFRHWDSTFVVNGVPYPHSTDIYWDLSMSVKPILPQEFHLVFWHNGQPVQANSQIEGALIDIFNKYNRLHYLHLVGNKDDRELSTLDYFTTPVKSITITADREMCGIAAGESLNSLFVTALENVLFLNIAYSNKTKEAFLVQDGMNLDEFVSLGPLGMNRFRLRFKSYEGIPSGEVTFHVRSEFVDGVSKESSVYVNFRRQDN